MLKRIILLSLFTITMIFSSEVKAQAGFNVKFTGTSRIEGLLGYTFFLGSDAADYVTSVKGFGSSLMDVWNSRSSHDWLQVGMNKAYISLGTGLAINKYRFSDNLVLSLDDNGVIIRQVDPDKSHDYVNTFFGYGKSKWVNASFFVPLNLNFIFRSHLQFSAGGFVDFTFYTKHKRKFIIGEEKTKVLVTPSEMKNYPLNKIKWGIHAGLYHDKWDQGISFTYYLTPVFRNEMGPDLHEARITLTYTISDQLQAMKRMQKNMESEK